MSTGTGTGGSSSTASGLRRRVHLARWGQHRRRQRAIVRSAEVLIVLDRTLTMHKTPSGAEPTDAPDYASSKWYQAINAIEAMVAAAAGQVDPVRPGAVAKESPGCITLAEKVANMAATNPNCEAGEVAIPPALGNGAAIANLLDPKARPRSAPRRRRAARCKRPSTT